MKYRCCSHSLRNSFKQPLFHVFLALDFLLHLFYKICAIYEAESMQKEGTDLQITAFQNMRSQPLASIQPSAPT